MTHIGMMKEEEENDKRKDNQERKLSLSSLLRTHVLFPIKLYFILC